MEIDKVVLAQILGCVLLLIVCAWLSARFALGELSKSRSIAYTTSLEQVRADARLVTILGDHIHRDWLMSGSPLPKPGSDIVNFEYSVVGRLGRGRVIVHAIQPGTTLTLIETRVSVGTDSEILLTH